MGRRKTRKAAFLDAMMPLGGTSGADPKTRQRQLLADMCRLIAQNLNGELGDHAGIGALAPSATAKATPTDVDDLPPRLRQTLQSLLAGDSEKQAARKLGLSQHTVHVYVKKLYRKYNVCSRGELLARWVKSD